LNLLRIAAAVAVFSGGLLSGCYSPPKPPDPTSAAASYPAGVLLAVSGIYADTPCCWLARDAEFQTLVPANASHLLLNVFTPSDIPKLQRGNQHVTVTVDGKTKAFANVPVGSKVLEILVRRAKSDRTVDVKMRMSSTFVPKEELGNGDTRTLSLYLRTVRAF
jgi:hypothetical protein